MSAPQAVTKATKATARAAAAANVNRSLLTAKQLSILDSPYKKTPASIIKFARTRANQLRRWRRPGTPFLVGQTEVYLPSFTVSLLRTPRLSADQAEFAVPLNFNKLDLRDYLWHVYQVRVFGVRSYIKPSPIQRVDPESTRGLLNKRKYYRPQARKRMIVDLEKPFVWPEEPTAEELKEEWDTERWKLFKEDQSMSTESQPGSKTRRERELTIHEKAVAKLEAARKARASSGKGEPKTKKVKVPADDSREFARNRRMVKLPLR